MELKYEYHKVCPKCGSTVLKTEYFYLMVIGEYLMISCECGFHWNTPCKDSVVGKEATGYATDKPIEGTHNIFVNTDPNWRPKE